MCYNEKSELVNFATIGVQKLARRGNGCRFIENAPLKGGKVIFWL